MFANRFADFRFHDGFWFSFAVFGAVSAVMLTASLNLDGDAIYLITGSST